MEEGLQRKPEIHKSTTLRHKNTYSPGPNAREK